MFRIKIKCTWRCGCLGCFLLLGHQEDGNKRNYEKNTRSLWWNPSFCVWSNGISLLSPLWDWRRFYEPVKVQTNLNVHIWRSLQFSALKSANPVFGWHFFWFLVFSFVLHVFFFYPTPKGISAHAYYMQLVSHISTNWCMCSLHMSVFLYMPVHAGK